MRRTGALAAEVLIAACGQVRTGITSDAIDRFVHDAAVAAGAYPSPLGYRGYPKSVCTSVNEVICHGIPRLAPAGLRRHRQHRRDRVPRGRARRHVGDVDGGGGGRALPAAGGRDARRPEQGHRRGEGRRGRVGDRSGHRGPRVQAPPRCGEGVHRPWGGHRVPLRPAGAHYHDRRATTVLEEAMTFTIEPMLTLGSPQVKMWHDGWTAVTLDGRLHGPVRAHLGLHRRRGGDPDPHRGRRVRPRTVHGAGRLAGTTSPVVTTSRRDRSGSPWVGGRGWGWG